MKRKFVLALIASTLLCIQVFAQQTILVPISSGVLTLDEERYSS